MQQFVALLTQRAMTVVAASLGELDELDELDELARSPASWSPSAARNPSAGVATEEKSTFGA